jgi:hypothetical protein
LDIDVSQADQASNAIEEMYDDSLDVLVVRNAFSPAVMATVGDRLDGGSSKPGWTRPNEKSPTEDIQMLGVPATPTYSAPRGPSLDAYLDQAAWHRANPVFDGSLDPAGEITRLLGSFSGRRPVELPHAGDGRAFDPFTVRKLANGTQISLHHDYHYPLPLYNDLAPRLDTRTLISYVITLRRPEIGGELYVYPVTPDMPDAPKLPNGWAWDLEAIEQCFPSAKFATNPGDLFLFASGRCLHRVAPTRGPRARVTMGGFLALNKDHSRVVYWS